MRDDTKRKLLLLGATGLTGGELLTRGLERGHDITALVRNPEKLAVSHPRLHAVVGDATDPAAIDQALEERDAVVCALGTRSPRSLISCDLMSASMSALVPSMKRRGVERIVVESALGVGETAGYAPPAVRLAFATALRQMGKDKARAEEYLGASDLDWTTIHPPSLTNGPWTGRYRAGCALALKGVPRISRADVADFMLSQLNDATFSRKSVIVGY